MSSSDPIDFLGKSYGSDGNDDHRVAAHGDLSHDDSDTSSEAPSDSVVAELTNSFVAKNNGGVSTPPRAADRSFLDDTPAGQHTTSSRSYQSGNLGEMRQAVREHIGPNVVEISFEDFAKKYLPSLKSGFKIRAITQLLTEKELFSSTKKVLAHFDDEPKRSKEREENVLEPLSGIFEEICRLASLDSEAIEPEYFFGMLPNYMPYADVSMEHRPDGSFIPKSKKEFATVVASVKGETEQAKKERKKRLREMRSEGKHITFHDIAVPFEGKKRVSGIDDNVVKITFHGQQLIAHDPCRRFVIGITTENTDLRLWFLSRTRTIVSKAFNFTTDIHKLIRVVVSLSFASRKELGYDPTIQPILEQNRWRYNIQVGEREYWTNSMIADRKAHAMLSTGTRVWDGTDVLSGDRVVVKDTWIECDRFSEKRIYEMILNDVEELYGEEGRDMMTLLLLRPIADCTVEFDENDLSDNSSEVGLFPLKTQKGKSGDRLGPLGSRGKGPPSCHHLDTSPASTIPSRCPRMHYRVVFGKTGNPLYTIKKLSDAFLILKNSTECLSFLHGCGWVHRDLSSGNVYLYQGRGLVGDLEYARKKSWMDAPHEMHTVNFDYMASEVIERVYLLSNNRSRLDSLPGSSRPPFRHNQLHDLESLWWIAIYVIFFMLETGIGTELDEKDIKDKYRRRQEARQALFPGTDNTTMRQAFLTEPCQFEDLTSWMPDSFEDIKDALETVRNELVQCYVDYEDSFEELGFIQLHELLIACFRRCETTAVILQKRLGCSLILESFEKCAATTAREAAPEDAHYSGDDEEVLEVTGKGSASSTGQGRGGQKRKRSPGCEASTSLLKSRTKQTEPAQSSYKNPPNPRQSKKTGGWKF